MLLIYTHKITNRNKYIFNLIFKDILGIDFHITTELQDLIKYSGAKINYSHQFISGIPFFMAHNLLFETGLSEQHIVVTEWRESKIFFATGKASVFPFDPFAASFYLVSRYEEYLPHIRDKYDRFDPKESIAYKNDFLHKPVVNIWTGWIRDLILETYPLLKIPERKYQFVSTIDIDNAYSYREKGFMRSLGGYLKALTAMDFKSVVKRTRVLLGSEKDPYDTYDFQLEVQKKYNLNPIYFFLMGDYGVNDKNLPVESRQFHSLIKSIADYAQVGIHPSYGSNSEPEKLKKELGRLSKILNREITKSRQHFLKLILPDTYRCLIDLDITDDYTMGYASMLGFRAGTCTPFNFYDLDMEIETRLKLHPFTIMEATLKYYLKVAPEDALGHIKPLIDEVRAVNGIFMSLWHNDSLCNQGEWRGWMNIYEEMVALAARGA